MNFKKACFILSLFSFSALGSPIQEEESGVFDLDSQTVSIEETTDSDFEFEECSTSECIETSKRILNSLDTSVDPCENFYQYTCGGYINNHQLKEGEYQVNGFTVLDELNNKYLNKILENDYPVDETLNEKDLEYDKKIFQKIKTFYNSCLNTEKINSEGKDQFINLINGIKIDKSKNEAEQLSELLAKVQYLNGNSLFQFDQFLDEEKSADIKPSITKSESGRVIDDYNDEKKVSIYKKFIRDTLSLIFDNKNESEIETMTNSIFEIEKKLVELNDESGDDFIEDNENLFVKKNIKTLSTVYPYVKEQKIKTLNKKYPFINWSAYFNQIVKEKGLKITFNEDSIIVNKLPKYFEELNEIMKEITVESFTDYIKWNLIIHFLEYLPDNIKEPLKEFNNNENILINNAILIQILNGDETLERNQYCTEVVNKYMNDILVRYFIKENFNDEMKKSVKKMVENIKLAMKNRIPEIEWLDEQTKANAIEKVLKMIDVIGYPEKLLKPQELYEIYNDYEIVQDEFLANVSNGISFSIKTDFNLIGSSLDRNEFVIPAEMVNAVYILVLNSMNIPAGILQPPFYNINDPDYLIYSSIGTIIGHELTHGFDNNGRKYDADGNFRNWWTNSTYDEFNNLAQCYVDQYSKFEIKYRDATYSLNGKKTLGENIADNGGLSRAYEAWQLSLNSEDGPKKNMLLPGLSDYSLDQLFYISFGQMWCSSDHELINLITAILDVHSPAEFRVNGSVSNSERFAKAFKCKRNTPMNPENKCSLW